VGGAREVIRRCRPLILFERNGKHITESMLSMIDIPQEVKAFRIEDYTSRLGYSEPLQLGDRAPASPPAAPVTRCQRGFRHSTPGKTARPTGWRCSPTDTRAAWHC
jgi:hypothetical protein